MLKMFETHEHLSSWPFLPKHAKKSIRSPKPQVLLPKACQVPLVVPQEKSSKLPKPCKT